MYIAQSCAKHTYTHDTTCSAGAFALSCIHFLFSHISVYPPPRPAPPPPPPRPAYFPGATRKSPRQICAAIIPIQTALNTEGKAPLLSSRIGPCREYDVVRGSITNENPRSETASNARLNSLRVFARQPH